MFRSPVARGVQLMWVAEAPHKHCALVSTAWLRVAGDVDKETKHKTVIKR